MALSEAHLVHLACPEDKGSLIYLGEDEGLYNPRLQRLYRIDTGIPIMLIDEADAVDDIKHAAIVARAESEGLRHTLTS